MSPVAKMLQGNFSVLFRRLLALLSQAAILLAHALRRAAKVLASSQEVV